MGAGLGLLVVVASVSCTSVGSRVGRPSESPTSAGSSSGSPSSGRRVIPPEGALLVLGGGGPLWFVPRSKDPIALAPGFVGYDISPDGSQVVATREEQLSTGISFSPNLVLIDTQTQDQHLLVTTGAKEEFNGPVKWSPDGTRLAYGLVKYPVNPANTHPGPRTELQTVCVIDVQTRESTCFRKLRRVFDFDWSPDGQTLVVTGPGPLPMQILRPSTGRVSVLVALDDPRVIQRLRKVGLGRPRQFLGPLWSPSGEYIAAWVNAPLPIPAIFTRSGHVVALGRAALGDAYTMSWKPGSSDLLYTTGYSLDQPRRWLLRELSAYTEEDRPLVSGPTRPLTTDFIASPSGRWLGMLRWSSDSLQELVFVDLTREGHRRRWSNVGISSSVVELDDWGDAP
jgi:hypothetical protein